VSALCDHGNPVSQGSHCPACKMEARQAAKTATTDYGPAPDPDGQRAQAEIDRLIREQASTGRPFSSNEIHDALPDCAPNLIGARFQRAAQRRGQLKAEVARLFALHDGKYGSPRITADLREAGWQVSENTVAALMREQRLAARRKNKHKSTTRPAKGRWRAPDLVKRDFPAAQVNKKWYRDGTEILTGEGKLCLASVLDMASRRIVGFVLGEHHDAQLACGALAMAVAVRGGQAPGVVFHTDQGSERIHRRDGPLCLRPAGHLPVDGAPWLLPVDRLIIPAGGADGDTPARSGACRGVTQPIRLSL
jgi:hypothetical protein